MNFTDTHQILQYSAWFMGMLELTAALYILALNTRHFTNRYVSLFLLFEGLVTLSIAQLVGTRDVQIATPITYLLAAFTPATNVWLLVVTLALLKPEWRPGRARWLFRGIYFVTALPFVFTAIDYFWGAGLWYSGLARTYAGGYVPLAEYTAGLWAAPLRALTLSIAPALGLLPILYVMIFERHRAPEKRKLVRVLLISHVAGITLHFILRPWLSPAWRSILTGFIFALVYGWAGYTQLVSARLLQRGSLRGRLTLLIFSIAAPILVAVSIFVSAEAGLLLADLSNQNLQSAGVSLRTNVGFWLDFNVKALRQMTLHPDITSMTPSRQQSYLQVMRSTYPEMYLISVIDLTGETVVRSDGRPPQNFSAQRWFQFARLRTPVSYATVVEPEMQQLSAIVAMPILDARDELVGIAMFATHVNELREQVRRFDLGETGIAYIVDFHDVVVVHSDPEEAGRLVDLSSYPPVAAARQGMRGLYSFTDVDGVRWVAYVDVIPQNDWVIIIQQQEVTWLEARRQFQQGTLTVLFVGGGILLFLIGLAVQQALRPVQTLTAVAAAVAAGDLTQSVPIETQDELGLLAQTFNDMTEQLRDLIAGLEQRIEERTQDLARRSNYQEASVQVARAVTSILDVERLIRQVVLLIRERFELYYVGLFLMDESGDWAVLRAGTGEAGQRMLARGHRIRVGSGMIGWAVSRGEARVAAEAAEDQVRQVNPDLPDTRSEAALPLRSRGRVIGALTVQSVHPGAFDTEALTMLQTMADQVAVAIDNATLYLESQHALESMRSAYGEFSRSAWRQFLERSRVRGFHYIGRTLHELSATPWRPEMLAAMQEGGPVMTADGLTFSLPVKVREQVAGVLRFTKTAAEDFWSADEKSVLESLVERLGQALESVQLYQEAQARAAREQMVGNISASMRAEVEVEGLLERALAELTLALDAKRAIVQLEVDEV